MKNRAKILLAALLLGTVAMATPAKNNPNAPVQATIDGWTPWANSIIPPPPPTR